MARGRPRPARALRRAAGRLSADARAFWDAHGDRHRRAASAAPASSSATSRMFRRRVLPLVHRRATRRRGCCAGGTPRRARALLRRATGTPGAGAAVPRVLLARRDGPAGPRSRLLRATSRAASPTRILARARHALTALDPADNPVSALDPDRHARRRAAAARCGPNTSTRSATNLDRLEWHCESRRELPRHARPHGSVDRLQPQRHLRVHVARRTITGCSSGSCRAQAPGGAPRLLEHARAAPAARRPGRPAAAARPTSPRGCTLQDKAFFYSAFVRRGAVLTPAGPRAAVWPAWRS